LNNTVIFDECACIMCLFFIRRYHNNKQTKKHIMARSRLSERGEDVVEGMNVIFYGVVNL